MGTFTVSAILNWSLRSSLQQSGWLRVAWVLAVHGRLAVQSDSAVWYPSFQLQGCSLPNHMLVPTAQPRSRLGTRSARCGGGTA
jgi:hypothetical protein